MSRPFSLIVHRGEPIPLIRVLGVAAELFGGHLRPDADLAVFASAPVRIRRGGSDPLADAVRSIHLTVREDADELLTALSPTVLAPRMGFGDEAEDGWSLFGGFPSEAVARALSEDFGAMAVLTCSDGPDLFGAYSLFSGGRRLWSALFVPAELYATWDGEDLRVETMAASDPTPPEGGHTDFPVHGLQLLFGETLDLTHRERQALLPSLAHACRPPNPDARVAMLARNGRFLAPETPLTDDELAAMTASFVEAPAT
jgi:hypothetical protein